MLRPPTISIRSGSELALPQKKMSRPSTTKMTCACSGCLMPVGVNGEPGWGRFGLPGGTD